MLNTSVDALNRRRHPRITVALSFSFTGDANPEGGENKKAITKDLSVGGLCFLTEDKVKTGDPIEVNFTLDTGDLISASLDVLRVRNVAGVFIAGGAFKDLPPESETALLEFSMREEERQRLARG